jgi:hypothetical protein
MRGRRRGRALRRRYGHSSLQAHGDNVAKAAKSVGFKNMAIAAGLAGGGAILGPVGAAAGAATGLLIEELLRMEKRA